MFSDPGNPTDGVSAVKALQLAAQEGQRIYQIDSSNLNTVLSEINLEASIEDEIRSYVMNGRVAIAHSNNISVPGWTGAGYILLDQETGIGSYKISGGGNGGFLESAMDKLQSILAILKDLNLIIDKLGGKVGEMLKKIIGRIETTLESIALLYNCGFWKGLVGILSISLFTIGIASLSTVAIAFGTAVGGGAGFVIASVISVYYSSTAVEALSSAWADSCN